MNAKLELHVSANAIRYRRSQYIGSDEHVRMWTVSYMRRIIDTYVSINNGVVCEDWTAKQPALEC